MHHGRILSCTLVLWLATTVVMQADQTDDFIRTEMRRQNIPGLSLAVLKRGEVVKVEGYGLANLKRKIPATPQTAYRIASVSKQFIAAGTMVLVQEGRLGLGDSVGKYRDKVFRPSGMNSTWPTNTTEPIPNLAQGYVDNDALREAPEWVALRPSGAFFAPTSWKGGSSSRSGMRDSPGRSSWSRTECARSWW